MIRFDDLPKTKEDNDFYIPTYIIDEVYEDLQNAGFHVDVWIFRQGIPKDCEPYDKWDEIARADGWNCPAAGLMRVNMPKEEALKRLMQIPDDPDYIKKKETERYMQEIVRDEIMHPEKYWGGISGFKTE